MEEEKEDLRLLWRADEDQQEGQQSARTAFKGPAAEGSDQEQGKEDMWLLWNDLAARGRAGGAPGNVIGPYNPMMSTAALAGAGVGPGIDPGGGAAGLWGSPAGVKSLSTLAEQGQGRGQEGALRMNQATNHAGYTQMLLASVLMFSF